MKTICNPRIITMCACLLLQGQFAQAVDIHLGNMEANKILFLGNSITTCPPSYWGLAASTAGTDYVHLLTGAIDAKTGGNLTGALVPETANSDGSANLTASNVINIADVFERGYATYTASKLQYQIDYKADIVVLQLGENVPEETFDAGIFESSLRTLVTDLEESSNPQIVMSSSILGSNTTNATVNAIKQDICAEDPGHRIFVDLSGVMKDPSNVGDYGHPSDHGMAVIADAMFNAMLTHSVSIPEPSSITMLSAAIIGLCCYMWRNRK